MPISLYQSELFSRRSSIASALELRKGARFSSRLVRSVLATFNASTCTLSSRTSRFIVWLPPEWTLLGNSLNCAGERILIASEQLASSSVHVTHLFLRFIEPNARDPHQYLFYNFLYFIFHNFTFYNLYFIIFWRVYSNIQSKWYISINIEMLMYDISIVSKGLKFLLPFFFSLPIIGLSNWS